MKKNIWAIVIVFIMLCLAVTSCSARGQARWKGTINLGDLPEDMLYVDGVPQIITISTESDGDVVLAYRANDDNVYAQLYGCAVITLNCDQLFQQGRYKWNVPQTSN